MGVPPREELKFDVKSEHTVPPSQKNVYIPSESSDDFMQANSKLDSIHQLPITASRTGTWAHSAFHNVTAMIGAGVLGLPEAISYLGWAGGVVTLVLSWLVSLYTLHQLVALHEYKGKRFNRYHELGQYTFGKKWGSILVITPQLIVMVGLGICYTVTGGQSLYRFWGLTCKKVYDQPEVYPQGHCETSMGQSAWIVIFGAVQLILVQCPDFNALSAVSFLAALMSLTYSTIAIGGSLAAGRQSDADYNLDGLSTGAAVLNIFNSLGVVAFAYGGHNVVLEIQATMRSPPATYWPYMRVICLPGALGLETNSNPAAGVFVAYGILSWCYFGTSLTGYWAFGNKVETNILFSINHPTWMVAVALFAVFIHVCGSYQVYTMPICDMIEMNMVQHGIPNKLPSRLIYRTTYVCLTTFVAVTIPFFGSLMGFIGALGTGPTTFWLPSVIWLVLERPSIRNWNFWASWACIFLGGSVTVLGAIGGLRGIIVSASTYKFYN